MERTWLEEGEGKVVGRGKDRVKENGMRGYAKDKEGKGESVRGGFTTSTVKSGLEARRICQLDSNL